MKHDGDLTITKANAKNYVGLVEVSGYLSIKADASLPALTSVGRSLQIKADISLPALRIAHGKSGQLIATSEYGLWLDADGIYHAGCQVNLTKDQALTHWARKDKRAIVFTEAIRAN